MLEILGETLEAGSIVAGLYRLERVVGEGGMGVVWAAHEIASRRRVALKFLREGRETDLRNQERVLREARAAMAISHPNVARVEAVLETNAGVPFLVMELLEGESLRDLLRRRHVLTPLECARILLPVVDAVLAAHASHVVHRDLKPENVFLATDQRVRVLDFGIAKQLPRGETSVAASLTSTGALLGTPIYMAPEQVFGDQDIDGSADVWSLGIVLYECLAGRRPTDGDGFGPIIKRITTEPLEPLEQAREGLPRRITSLVGRMLTRSRGERPPLVEVRAILASIVDAGEGAAPSERAPDPPPRPAVTMAASTTGGVAGGRAVESAPAPPRAGRRAVPIAIAVAALLGIGAATAVRFAREKPAAEPAAPFDMTVIQRGSALLHETAAAQARRDGVACLSDLDRYDRDHAAASRMIVSTDPASSNAGTRALCMMIVGRCAEGEALYRQWLVPFLPEGGASYVDQSVEALTTNYCEGDDVPPRIALARANQRLSLWGNSPAYPKATVAQCRAWADAERRLLPVVGPLPTLVLDKPLEERLADCTRRAAAPRDE